MQIEIPLAEQSTNGRLALSNADDPHVVLAQGDAVRIQTEKLYSKNVVPLLNLAGCPDKTCHLDIIQ
jgi:hypothetical protein